MHAAVPPFRLAIFHPTRGGLDLLGVMVISFVAALGGGVIRDLLIGDTPPNAIRDWRYPALTFATGLLIRATKRSADAA